MITNMIVTGVGGQGNVMASQVIGHAAVKKGNNVFIGETFGLSQRGGPVLSHVRVSDEGTLGPLIPEKQADIVLGLEPVEALRVLEDYGNKNTVVITNNRPAYPINVIAGEAEYPNQISLKKSLEAQSSDLYWLNLTEDALKLGNPILLNVLLLGALANLPRCPIDLEDLKYGLEAVLPIGKLELNLKALEIGFNHAANYDV